MNMDAKEKKMLTHYREIIEKRQFDEYDILGFLIFIRRHLNNLKYIYEFADLIAHRERDRGIVMNNIYSTIENDYKTKKNSNQLQGYYGMNYEDWVKEWKDFASEYDYKLNDDIIKEITICVFSLSQYTQYNKSAKYSGKLQLFQGKYKSHNYLALVTIGNDPNTQGVCFAKCGPIDFIEELSAGDIEEPVEALRVDGKLRLKYNGKYII